MKGIGRNKRKAEVTTSRLATNIPTIPVTFHTGAVYRLVPRPTPHTLTSRQTRPPNLSSDTLQTRDCHSHNPSSSMIRCPKSHLCRSLTRQMKIRPPR
jgi:hypothetical protein